MSSLVLLLFVGFDGFAQSRIDRIEVLESALDSTSRELISLTQRVLILQHELSVSNQVTEGLSSQLRELTLRLLQIDTSADSTESALRELQQLVLTHEGIADAQIAFQVKLDSIATMLGTHSDDATNRTEPQHSFFFKEEVNEFLQKSSFQSYCPELFEKIDGIQPVERVLHEMCNETCCCSFLAVQNKFFISLESREVVWQATEVFDAIHRKVDCPSAQGECNYYVGSFDAEADRIGVRTSGYNDPGTGRFWRSGTLDPVSLHIQWGAKEY